MPSDHPFDQPRCGDTPFVCWPTIGPSSVDLYTAGAVPGWANSLLITSLKYGTVYRVKLSADGRSTVGDYGLVKLDVTTIPPVVAPAS